MCGITGILHFENQRTVEKKQLKEMTDIIQHRGPDGEGFFIDKNIGLGHRRLSIIDLETGDQPMFSDDKQKVLVFNGEIYNYIELREELKNKGYKFYSNSDTEVVIKAYEEWGYDCQNKFNGMWAFALWDNRKHQLFISRDRIGEKPLHYAIWDNTFLFASEIKALIEYGVPKRINYDIIQLYLILKSIPEPYTFYKDIYKLKAGHYAIIKDGKLKEEKYWDLPLINENQMITDKGYIYSTFNELFNESVKIRMRSDVPFGAFLSGGLDSSAVVATMSGISKYPVNTLTIGFEEKQFDESKLAKEVAKKFKTNHIEKQLSQNYYSNELIDKIAFHYDEPFGDSSAIPTGYVSKFAAEKVKMVLTGDGGDEALSGYNTYLALKISNLINKVPKPFQTGFISLNSQVATMFSGTYRYKLNKIKDNIERSNLSLNQKLARDKNFNVIKDLVKPLNNIIDPEEYLNDFINKSPYKDDFYNLMYFDYKYKLPNNYLVKVDRMSMAYSLETRLPFLDYKLVEFMAKVDKNVKLSGWERKSILRNTIGKSLPNSILKASKKGFRAPLRDWFKTNSFNRSISVNLKEIKQLLDNQLIEKIIKDNNQGKSDYGNLIWELLILNKFLK